MNIVTLSTNNINVFPSTRRSDILPSARYLTEATFTEQIRRICNYTDPNDSSSCIGSFIITAPSLDDKGNTYFDEEAPFEFYIYGYYFCIRQLRNLTQLTAFKDNTITDIYAYIDLDEFKTDSIDIKKKTELIGRDETTTDATTFYTGIKFTDDSTTAKSKYYLHLFHREFDTTTQSMPAWKYNFYKNSIQRISVNSIQIDIDGGVIE